MAEDSASRRWDTDTVGYGVADGTAFAPGVQRLRDALHLPGWVAEDPDAHLLPHLERICAASDSPWSLAATAFADGVYDVTLEWSHQDENLARLRADMFSLIGAIAEGVTYVHQRVTDDQIVYELVTGLLDGETHFRGHGHLVRFRVAGDAASSLLTRMRRPVTQNSTIEP